MPARSANWLLLFAASGAAALGGARSAAAEAVALHRTGVQAPRACSADGLCIDVGVALADPGQPDACSTQTSIVADVGDQLAWCYTLTNGSDHTLSWHTLSDSLHGDLFAQLHQDIAPGESWRYIKLEVAGAVVDGDVAASWTASGTRPDYAFDDGVAFDYIDATDGTLLDLAGGFSHARSARVQAPFPVGLFGTRSDVLCVGANGAIQPGSAPCAIPMTYAFPSTYVTSAIAPAWSGYADGVGSVYTKVLGSTPGQRRFVVEWTDLALDWPSMPGFTFEVVIDEASGGYLFQYLSTGSGQGDFGDAGGQAIAGLQADGTTAQTYSSFAPALTPGKAVQWTLQAPADALSTTTSVHADVGAPHLVLPVAQLDAFAASGIVVSQPIVVGNDGNRTLQWSAGEYPASSVAARPLRATPRTAFDASALQRHPAKSAGSSARSPAGVLGTPGLPAYAVQLDTSTGAQDYIGLDLFAPDAANAHVILPDIDLAGMNIAGGDFVDNDFSREWMVDYYYNELYTLDTTDGTKTLVGWPVPQMAQPNEQWWGVAWDPASGALYAVTNATNGWSGLYTIDRQSAVATFVGRIDVGTSTTIADIAIDQSGAMVGLDTLNDTLVAIDKATGQASVVGPLGVDAKFAQGIKFDRATGVLYWTSYDATGAAAVATIDPITGTPTPVAPSGDHRQLFALAIAKAGGDCTQPLDAPWLTLSTAAGTLAQGAPFGVYDVTFDATALAPGDYAASICVFSNDPTRRTRPAIVPVHFNVAPAAGDALFGDGFDG
ncbi:hypothetical protein FHW12_003602 [Dokdonella fugitiva]|uniref:Uncharacterized protein n=1 Tax=Dokdonella fugitiva TaxID=328517 RepID=A0A839F6E3_9GAMM|nr:hypothetical protein [Dokdonella fugitiva]MBA8889359.1 hypothetical protein [Dokdonella fugitiva]